MNRWRLFVVGWALCVAALWGALEVYTYFEGDRLKNLLGDYWPLGFLVPAAVIAAIAAVGSREERASITFNVPRLRGVFFEYGKLRWACLLSIAFLLLILFLLTPLVFLKLPSSHIALVGPSPTQMSLIETAAMSHAMPDFTTSPNGSMVIEPPLFPHPPTLESIPTPRPLPNGAAPTTEAAVIFIEPCLPTHGPTPLEISASILTQVAVSTVGHQMPCTGPKLVAPVDGYVTGEDSILEFTWDSDGTITDSACVQVFVSRSPDGPFYDCSPCTRDGRIWLKVRDLTIGTADPAGLYYWTIRVQRELPSGLSLLINVTPEPRKIEVLPSLAPRLPSATALPEWPR